MFIAHMVEVQSCIEINCDNELIILDAEFRIKFLGKDIMKRN